MTKKAWDTTKAKALGQQMADQGWSRDEVVDTILRMNRSPEGITGRAILRGWASAR